MFTQALVTKLRRFQQSCRVSVVSLSSQVLNLRFSICKADTMLTVSQTLQLLICFIKSPFLNLSHHNFPALQILFQSHQRPCHSFERVGGANVVMAGKRVFTTIYSKNFFAGNVICDYILREIIQITGYYKYYRHYLSMISQDFEEATYNNNSCSAAVAFVLLSDLTLYFTYICSWKTCAWEELLYTGALSVHII